jgi:hypothetical protein
MQGSTRGVPIDTDNTLSLDSDIVVASQKAVKAFVTNQLALKEDVLGFNPLNVAGGSMTGYLTLNNDPTNALHAATKQYVDNIATGINFHQPVHAATTGNLSATYSNGTGGIGATLTATANGALIVDGHTLLVNERVLVWQQSSGLQNGTYVVTDTGSPTTPFILTRASDDDQSPPEMMYGDFSFVQQGTLYGGYGFINNTSGTITIGVTAITYVQFNAAQVVTAGYGLLESTPNVLSVDTTVIAPLNNPSFTGTVSGITATMVGLGSVVNADTTTTANITDSTNKRFVTDAQLVVIGNTSGTNTGDETTSSIKTKLGAATSLLDGYLTSADWSTFNGKQNAITTGTTLEYFRGDLSLATFPTIPTVGTWGALNYPTWISGTPFVKMTAAGTFTLDSNVYGTGTVTSVSALTIDTTGTDIGSTVVNSTTTPIITLSVPTASATNRGALSSADWTTFNSKASQLYAYVAASPTVSTSSTTYTDITDLSVTLDASSTYKIECWLNLTSSSTAGLQIGATWPSGSTVGLNGRAPTNSTSAQTYYRLTTSGALGSGTIVTNTTAGAPVYFNGIVTTGVTSGVFKVGYAKVTSGTVTANFGSYLVATKIA